MAFTVGHAARQAGSGRPRPHHRTSWKTARRPGRGLAGARLQLLPVADGQRPARRSTCSTPTRTCSPTAGRRAAASRSCSRSPTASATAASPGTARTISCRSTTGPEERHPRLRLPPAMARPRPGRRRRLGLGDRRVPRLASTPRTASRLWPADYDLASPIGWAPAACGVEAEVINPDTKPLPFGLGYHPYFRLPFAAGGRAGRLHASRCRPRRTGNWTECLPTGHARAVDAERDLNAPRRFADLHLDDVLTDLPRRRRAPTDCV